MNDRIENLLVGAGYAETEAVSVANTIRPGEADATLAAPTSMPPPAQLPNLDLRATRGPGSPTEDGQNDLNVVSILGEGGMGRVFLARQRSVGRDVAIKTAKFESAEQALLAEGAITGQLEHPGIVPVHALGLDREGRVAMVMKRIEGVDWDTLAANPAHDGWEGWPGDKKDRTPGHLQIFVAVCNAVHFAHSRGVVHRDIKLDNIMIGRFGDVYLADWGIATRLGERPTSFCGTPGYMAPEMVDLHTIDARTDVYLLGASLHKVLTGEMRHAAPSAITALHSALLSASYEYEAGIPHELANLINRACHLDPEQRPQSAQEFRDEVAKILAYRDAAALADEAAARTERIEALLDGTLTPAESADVDRMIAEASFGFERAFASGWGGTPEVLAARQRLELAVNRRREHVERLEHDAAERDPTKGSRQRALLFAGVSVFGLCVEAYAYVIGRKPSVTELIMFPALIYGGVAVWSVLKWHQIKATAFYRNSVVVVHALMLMLIAGRLSALFVEIEVSAILTRDSLMLAAAFGAATIGYARWLGWVSLMFFVSFGGCTAYPEHATAIFSATASLVAMIAAAFQWATPDHDAKFQ